MKPEPKTPAPAAPKEVVAGPDGAHPEFFNGENLPAPASKDPDDKIAIKIPKVNKESNLETMLYLNCKRPNVEKLKDPCDCQYIIDEKTTFCTEDELKGLFPVAEGKTEVAFEFKCKGASMGKGPTFQCKAFLYDSVREYIVELFTKINLIVVT